MKAAIFDLDGVLVDTVPLHFESWKRLFHDYGEEFTFEDYKEKVDGIPREDGVRAILTNLSPEEILKAGDRKQNYFVRLLHDRGIVVFDSSATLIGSLKAKGVKVAVISSSKNCSDILKKIGLMERLDAVVDRGQVEKGKPDPEMFLKAAQACGALASESVVFEDAVLGVEAAKRGGMICVGIDRYSDPERLKKADLVVPDLSDVTYEKLVLLFKK